MKKGRLFAAIIYFIFTFAIGLILAFTLPGYLTAFTIPTEYVNESLQKGDYQSAMVLLGDCYNKNYVVQRDFESGGGMVLFETVIQYTSKDDPDTDSSADTLLNGMLYKTYMGYVYGISDSYKVFSVSNNQTKLIVTDFDGHQTEITLLDYDSNGDGTLDGISTVKQNGFMVLDLSETTVNSVKTLTFVDCDGKVFEQVFDLSELNLGYTSDFFSNFDGIDEYNSLVRQYIAAQSTVERAEIDKQLVASFNSMTEPLKQNDSYAVISEANEDYIRVMNELSRRANKKSIPITIVYFVVIYVIADFLLGSHLIIKFFKWFLYKVCKVKPRNKQKLKKNEIFGSDYYSSVTVSLDLAEVPDFNESVQIKYTNTDVEVVFILLKENNYTATERIKAGVYVNPFVDMNRDYAPTNLPENLEVEGYKMDLKIKIIKREV